MTRAGPDIDRSRQPEDNMRSRTHQITKENEENIVHIWVMQFII